MPILNIEIVTSTETPLNDGLSARLADAAAAIFQTRPGGVWVRMRPLPSELYAEDSGGPPDGVQPVFVSVLKSQVPSDDKLPDEIRKLTEAIAQACQRPPEHVHILYLPSATGRMAFGGSLV